MKILFLNHNIIGRSTYLRCFAFAHELVRLGNEVTILTNSKNNFLNFKQEVYHGVKIVETPDLFKGNLRTGWDPVNCIRRTFYISKKNYDLIHCFDSRPAVIIPALFYRAFIKRIPVFMDWADWWGRGGAISFRRNKIINLLFEPVETFFEEYFRKKVDYNTVISKTLFQRAVQLGVNRQKIIILPNGFQLQKHSAPSKAISKQKINISKNRFIILFPSFVHYDIDILLKTIHVVSRKLPQALLLLIGQKPTVNNRELLNKLMSSGHIKYMGEINNERMLEHYFHAANATIMPLSDNVTNQARQPMKLSTIISEKVPLITNEVGDFGNLLRVHKLAYICSYNEEAFAGQLMKIYSRPYAAQSKALRAYKFFNQEFSWRRLARKLNTIYLTVAKANSR